MLKNPKIRKIDKYGFTPTLNVSRYGVSSAKAESGFTIIEALVSVAIFAMVITSIIGVFLAVLRINEKSRAIRLVEQNARHVSELLARELRNGAVNYAAYAGTIPNTTGELHLVNKDGDLDRYRVESGSLRLQRVSAAGTAEEIVTNQTEVVMSNLVFRIEPGTNPFCPGACPDEQPRVTFLFTITSNTGLRTQDQFSESIQSTLTSRQYPDF